jgi:hypothetical protein
VGLRSSSHATLEAAAAVAVAVDCVILAALSMAMRGAVVCSRGLWHWRAARVAAIQQQKDWQVVVVTVAAGAPAGGQRVRGEVAHSHRSSSVAVDGTGMTVTMPTTQSAIAAASSVLVWTAG